MKTSVYLKSVSDIKDKVDALCVELIGLKENYISINSIFDIDDRVKIVTPAHKAWRVGRGRDGRDDKEFTVKLQERFAYVVGHRIEPSGHITYLLKKEKIDGSISKVLDHYNESMSYLDSCDK